MRPIPDTSVTRAPQSNDVNRAKSSRPGGKAVSAPQDGIRISSEFETLSVLQGGQATKVARVAAAVGSGTYEVDTEALSKSIIEDVLR